MKHHATKVGGVWEANSGSTIRQKLKHHATKVGGVWETNRGSTIRQKLKYHATKVGGILEAREPNLVLLVHIPAFPVVGEASLEKS